MLQFYFLSRLFILKERSWYTSLGLISLTSVHSNAEPYVHICCFPFYKPFSIITGLIGIEVLLLGYT